MLEIDDASLKTISSSIDEALKLVDEKKDIRIVVSSIGKVYNKIRGWSELTETPDNGFVSVIFAIVYGTLSSALEHKEEEWFALNRELTGECLVHVKNLLLGIKSSLTSRSFDEAITVLKTSTFVINQTIVRMSD